MKTIDYQMMLAHCDQLTSDGNRLSVNWEGGNDSGWLFLMLNGQRVDEPSDIEIKILDLMEEQLGYGSFAGDFSTDGEAVYDRQTKCFQGEDNYSETDSASITDCQIPLQLPEDLWFDRIELEVEYFDERIHCTLHLHIANGPYTAKFDQCRTEIEKKLAEHFEKECSDIEDFASVWDTYRIPFSEFTKKDGHLRYDIHEFNYSFYTYQLNQIQVSLLEEEQQED